MQESERRSAARAADAREPTTVERQYDSLQSNAEQFHISDATLDDRSTVTPATDDRPSDAGTMKDDGTLDTCTLRTEVGLHGRPELEFASEGALDAALARLREEHGDRVTEDDLGQEVMVDAVEAAMIEAGEMNLETVCERLSDATNVDE
ncbi:hypothetical protein MF271_21650 (plasmid) [Deinococcus sp. KNUC1210]|uniref:hypothetical protein n=1 Tax=Deinococcus sp. KNUC1210 TaxID=2917691 RepID=UPI001EF0F0E5|nr:hypothetical protein [Deinococcus sp. KNUC1210]ULH17876.1 hypothetical protein MF271_21650 [Deinococcus sp. KNUC1210]